MSVDVERPSSHSEGLGRGMARLIRHAGDDPDARPTIIHRVILVVAAFSMFSTLIGSSGPTVRWPILGVALTAGICALVVVAVCSFTMNTMRWFGRVELFLALLAVGCLTLWMFANIFNFTGYRSDEEIFVQYSANLLRHGHNPYRADLMPAYSQYPSPFPTKLLDGTITHRLDYPALPTLLTTVLTMMVGDFHTVALLCTLALVAALVVMYVLLPRGLRSLAALLVVGIPVLATGSAGGLLFALIIAPLAFAAHRWQHIGEGGRLSKTDIAKAVAVGAAVATTQVAWFPIPFLVLGILLTRQKELGRRGAVLVTLRFVAYAAATFLLINLPFIIWDPKSWLRGSLAPLTQHAVPEGEGLINVIQSLSMGSGDLSLYTYAGALFMLGVLVAYWRHFDRLSTACFALPLISLLFPTRSYWTYFVAYSAAWVVALLSQDEHDEHEHEHEEGREGREGHTDAATAAEPAAKPAPLTARIPWLTKPVAITAAAFLPAVLVLGAALASPQPLTIKIDNYLTSAQLESVQTVTLTATNKTGQSLEPHFMAIHNNGMVSDTWNIIAGPAKLAPHTSAQYTVTAPSVGAMPTISGGLKMQVVTDSPATVSYSRGVTVEPYITQLTYEQPSTPLLGQGGSIVLTARTESQLGTPYHHAGLRICLSQTKFTNSTTDFPDSVVAASPAGDIKGCGFTDAKGEVKFTLTNPGAGSRQLYFQSFGMQGSYGRFGYSSFLSVAWR